ncbi:MAG: PSD1 and planctomycete cytochrome C domain-containing protein [Planctomycetota bacterium]|mgnify:CR=1 FL=1|nr:PSD1 and planctomycete cytochrome C domain-containing protein [Planctomycetota bacterium]
MTSRIALSAALALAATTASFGADEPKPPAQSAEGVRYFETHIRPLLVKHCYECHGEKKQEASLRLDTWATLMKGGDTGTPIVEGKPEQSLLLTAVKYQDPNLQMPPEKRLSKQDVAKFEHWIKIGAPHPDAGDTPIVARKNRISIEEGREFWSFRQPVKPPLPEVKDGKWATSEIDRFILKKLEEHGLQPAPPADRRTLIRCTTQTMIGLPPTAEEVEAFLNDESADAFEKVVDRLLASPHYGERWGRHWLDVARYADSNGLDENIHHGNAWRYRDYVVNSLNKDKPYDQFLIEQIAGDLLPTEGVDEATRYERLIATGFLAIGPKVLAEVDETKMEMDIIDEQLDTLGRAVMGLTLGCARCHDHKFDPIGNDDYYALAGIFKSTKTMEHYTKIARWWEVPIPTVDDRKRQADHKQQIDEAKSKVDSLIVEASKKVLASLPEGTSTEGNLEDKFPAETNAELKKLRDAVTKLEKAPPAVSTAMAVTEREAKDLPIHIRGSHLTLGDVVPRRFPRVLAGDDQTPLPKDGSGRLELARWLTSDEHPLTSRVIANRVWRWHFGNGLVGSPDNFGIIGQEPINQPLLDWLAVSLTENGWSLKWLHKKILMSQTWQMSSQLNEHAQSVDPENQLQWRANVKRLEAEAIRDSILAVSGQLDRTFGGTLITIENRSFFFDHTSRDLTDYSSLRRSIYLPVVRNHLYEVFSLFDYSDAGSVVGNRTTSTVAPQALFMMNSEFMQKASDALAKQVESSRNNEEKVKALYRIVLTRPPSKDELSRTLQFLHQSKQLSDKAEVDSIRLLAQTLLSSNEFIYLR